MATFYDNLRASGNIPENTLPTRGDLQKQRHEQSKIDPNSFVNFLRIALGIQRVPKDKKRLNIEDVPPQNIDKASPEASARASEQEEENLYRANNGTLNLENSLDKYNAAVNGTIDVPYGHSEFENAYGILDNYSKLNDVLDEYDSINTWAEKKKYLENAYKKFKNEDKRGDVAKWFNKLYGYTLEAQAFGEWNTKAVTDVMRQINNNVKDQLVKES